MKRNDNQNKRTNKYMKIGLTFGDAMQLDQAIYQLAAYDTARGLIMIPETIDQAADLQKNIAKKFNYFKRLIQNSEISFDDIQRSVIERNGPFPSPKHNLTTDQVIDQVIKESTVNNEPSKEVMNVLQKLFEDIVQISDKDPRLVIHSEYPENNEEYKPNPFLFRTNMQKTDTPVDKISQNNRVLPKIEENEGIKPSKGKYGRRIKPKSNKNTKNKRNT